MENMTLDERYKIQRKKNDKLEEKIASLELEKNLRQQGIDEEADSLKELMAATLECYEELKRSTEELERYKAEYRMVIATLRDAKEEIFQRLHMSDADDTAPEGETG